MKLTDFIADGDLGRSTADRVSEILRQAIIGRVFEAGEHLVEAKVAQDLNVSITPVRQAFSSLATQGLLTVFPYKGSYVTILTQESIADLTFIRLQVESLAVEHSFKNLRSEDAVKIMELCKLSDYHLQVNNLYQSIHCDRLVHEFFVARADSPLLMEIWQLIKNRLEYAQTFTKRKNPPADYIQCRHEHIIRAVEQLDKDALLEAVQNHITRAMNLDFFPKESDIQYK